MEAIAIPEKFLNISNIKNINIYGDTPINVNELWTFTQNIDSTVNITNFTQFREVYSEFLRNYFTNEWKLYEYLYDKTQKKKDNCIKEGYKYIEIWGCEWTKIKKNNELLNNYITFKYKI